MAEPKTRPTASPVRAYLDAIDDAPRRADADTLAAMMRRVSGCEPTMWGPAIVGYGSYRYPLSGGKTGESCATGWSARSGQFSVYLTAEGPRQPALLAQLGKHKMGRACLTIKRLSDVDLSVLEQLVADSLAELARRHPTTLA
ncbi:MAG: DUF1801 domain-containing protein [Rubrivivax sp.]|jgi:hypothetical protein|nr:DUF1801 domain-containing protein [Rubrivivax sp.]